jgi:hypothetical protein
VLSNWEVLQQVVRQLGACMRPSYMLVYVPRQPKLPLYMFWLAAECREGLCSLASCPAAGSLAGFNS